MTRRVSDVGLDALAAYDAIIDVRSPAEFARDHLPGAINLPVLDDAERAEIGEIYIRRSKFLARRLGAAKVARNIAAHLDGPLADREGSFRPLIYCWRGGQRSGAMATVMDQVGWPVAVLEGGHRTWRRAVVERLHPETIAKAPPLRLVLLDGPTGVGKTEVLAMLAARGVQTLDLEALAEHRGSVFGGLSRPQPSQTLFESRLFVALSRIDPARPVVVEAESSRIGTLTLPPVPWAAMKAAPRIALSADVGERVDHILATYADIAADPARLASAVARLPGRHGRKTLDAWAAMARQGRLDDLVAVLLEQHYDPAYARGRSDAADTVPSPLFAPDPAERARRLDRIAALAETLAGVSRETPS